MEKLKENYINIDPRLEYMEQIATLYVPDIDIDPSTDEKYICGTAALPFFINRYNQNGLYGHFTYEDYTIIVFITIEQPKLIRNIRV